jgi:glucosamine--fructose-6-phosphate aminotransferase (isomerizing)
MERPTSHPFNMYRHIHQQPDAFGAVLEHGRAAVERFADQVAGLERLFVVGIGTSWHATLMMEHFMRLYGGGMPAHAVHSFDFVHYGPALTTRDAVVVISHTARKSYSVRAVELLQGSDVRFALLTGEEGAGRIANLEHVLVTTEPDGSATYTISYIGALAALAQLAAAIGSRRTGAATLDDRLLRDELPRAMRGAVETDEQMRSLAGRHSGHRRYWLAGAGPAGIAALEAALKIKESSYLQAEGIPTEQMLHGPFQCVEPGDLMLLAAPEGAGQARTLDLAREAKEIPLDLLVVSDGSADAVRDLGDGWVSVPRVPEPFSHITTLIPLQLFAYWLAIERGTNPDRFRLDDERFLRAFQVTTL